jgi:hypothetical protein
MAAEADGKRSRRRDTATLIALAGLVVTMIFNTLSVGQAAQSAAASRADADMSLLTSLSTYAQQADVAIAGTNAERAECNHRITLSRRDRRRLLADVESYDYMAWLMSQRSWKLPQALDYWGPSMVRALEIAENDEPNVALNHRFPSLYAFRHEWMASHPDYKPKC